MLKDTRLCTVCCFLTHFPVNNWDFINFVSRLVIVVVTRFSGLLDTEDHCLRQAKYKAAGNHIERKISRESV